MYYHVLTFPLHSVFCTKKMRIFYFCLLLAASQSFKLTDLARDGFFLLFIIIEGYMWQFPSIF